MSGMAEFFVLFGFLVIVAMLWELKKRIQTATEATASKLESQRLAIERAETHIVKELAEFDERIQTATEATASKLESQRLAIERAETHIVKELAEFDERIQTATETTASTLDLKLQAIEGGVLGVKHVLEELAYMNYARDDQLRHNHLDIQPTRSAEYQGERPVFVATVFKSGTKLLEYIVSNITGFGICAPTMSAGSDYKSVAPIRFESGKFFIWHNVPTDRVKTRLIAAKAQPIFLIRNIYDLAVSQYFHFAKDLDAEINFSTRTADYFSEMSQEEGISLLLSGVTSERFNWHGFGYYLRQIQYMLQFSKEYPCHVVIYDRLVQDKRREIERLATFLAIQPSDELLDELIGNSSLASMRKERVSLVGTGNHFRKGIPGDHVNVLKPWHYHMINQIKLSSAPRLDDLCRELSFEDVITAMPM